MAKFERDGLLASDPDMTEAAFRFMKGYLRNYLSDVHTIADVTQSAMVELVVKLRGWDGELTAEDTFRFISNCAKNALRREFTRLGHKLVSFEPEQHSMLSVEYEQTLTQREELERVEALLDEHKDRDRAIFIAKVQGYSNEEIARMLDTTKGAVRAAASRARKRLRVQWSAKDQRKILIELAKCSKRDQEYGDGESS